ncbi:MAG: hypothetical protein AB2A00_21455 [Myxococcota bacterium]
MKVLLAGEGPTELGGWANEPAYRTPENPGLLEVLARRIRPDGWEIGDAIIWKYIRKYRSGDHRTPEQRNLLGALLLAHEKGLSGVVFSRDRDGDVEREHQFNQALARAAGQFPSLTLAGGMAVEEIEAWVLAMRGDKRAERHRDPKQELGKHGVVGLEAMRQVAEKADLAQACAHSPSLASWLERAKALGGAKTEPSAAASPQPKPKKAP